MIIELITFIIVILTIIFLIVSFGLTLLGNSPYVPTTKKAAQKILKHSDIKKGNIVYDIGAGDGRLIHYAEKYYGAKATGFEINPFIYYLARLKQILLGWKGKMIRGNLFNQNLSNANAIVCYMTPKTLEKFQDHFIKKLKKGTKIISYAFRVGTLKPFKIIPKGKGTSRVWIYKV